MKMTFRHYGPGDPVTLQQISQIPTVKSIVSAVYDVPAGGVWSRESIARVFAAKGEKVVADNLKAFDLGLQ